MIGQRELINKEVKMKIKRIDITSREWATGTDLEYEDDVGKCHICLCFNFPDETSVSVDKFRERIGEITDRIVKKLEDKDSSK